MKKITGRVAAALGLALVVTIANPAPVGAVAYGGQCGGGYGKVNEAAIPGGTVFLTYNNSNGKNCVVVLRSNIGERMSMDAALKQSGGTSWQTDPGNFTEYAGPVYLSAAGQCVDWGGKIGNDWVVRNGTNCG